MGFRTRLVVVGATVVAVLASVLPAVAAAAPEPDVPGTAREVPAARSRSADPSLASTDPGGLRLVVNERGRLSRSISAVASGAASGSALAVQKPVGATVRRASLAVATTGFTGAPLSAPLDIDGQQVVLGEPTASGISSFNYFSDVTALVKSKIDGAAAGEVPLTVTEPEPELTDGTILVVVFDDPTVTTDQTVSVLFGALQPSGDRYGIRLARPISLADPATRLEMSLGISYSYQSNGTQQFSTVDVNGTRITSSAGGEDDGFSANGGLITVGGTDDSAANPADLSPATIMGPP